MVALIMLSSLNIYANEINFVGRVVDNALSAKIECMEKAINEGQGSVCASPSGSVIHAVVKEERVLYRGGAVTARFITMNFS